MQRAVEQKGHFIDVSMCSSLSAHRLHSQSKYLNHAYSSLSLSTDVFHLMLQSITLIPEFAHTGPRISVPRRNSSQYVFRRLIFGYTGFLIYRTPNLSPNQSGIRAIDCISLRVSQANCNIKNVPTVCEHFLPLLFRREQIDISVKGFAFIVEIDAGVESSQRGHKSIACENSIWSAAVVVGAKVQV